MVKQILYISLTFLVLAAAILIGLIFYKNSKKHTEKVNLIDVVEDPLADHTEGRNVFNINCAACHSISGISDPDLLVNLDTKMDKSYFHLFITQQDSLIKNGDKYQTEEGSYTDFSHVAISHIFNNLDRKATNDIYDYIIAAKSR